MKTIFPAESIKALIIKILEEHKALDIVTLDVRDMTDITDYMIICGANSRRHAKALAEHITVEAKKQHISRLRLEGEISGEWILVDLRDVIVHIMLPEVREFYDLEGLWSNM